MSLTAIMDNLIAERQQNHELGMQLIARSKEVIEWHRRQIDEHNRQLEVEQKNLDILSQEINERDSALAAILEGPSNSKNLGEQEME